MKIYVAYAGGTIVMVASAQGYVPDADFAQTVTARLAEYQPQHEFQA